MRLSAFAPHGEILGALIRGEARMLLIEAIGSGRTGTMIHSRRSGEEIFAALAGAFDTSGLPTNPVETIRPGDVVVAAFPPHYRDAPPERIVPAGSGYLHLGFIYGEAFRWTRPEGSGPVAVVGHLDTDVGQLAANGTRIRLGGSEEWVFHLERESE